MRLAFPPALIAAFALLSSAGARADSCKPVDAPIVTYYVAPTSCASPFGLCTAGTIATGPLAGTTSFTVLTLAPGPTPYVMLYTGELVITTRRGTVTVKDSGVFDAAAGKYFELEQIVSGTGKFANATGVLTSQGTGDNAGFKGTLTGQVCRGEREERDAE